MNCRWIKFILLTLLFQNIANSIFAQTKEIDSLHNILYLTKDDKKQLAILFLLCDKANSINHDSLYKYFTRAAVIAKKENNKEAILQTNLYKASYFSRTELFDSAENIINKTVGLLTSEADTFLKYRFLTLRSNVLIRDNKCKESMNNSLQLLHMAEQTNDTLTQVRAKVSIGWAYMELGQNHDALNWFFEASDQEKYLDDKMKPPFLYSDIAAVYNELNNNDSAIFYIKKALSLPTTKNDLSYLANTYFIYGGICADMGYKDQAENLLQKGLEIRKQIGDAFYIVSDIFQMGLFYEDNNEPDKGIAILQQGITMARTNNLFSKLPILYTALAKNYKKEGNYKKYSETLDTLIALKDSLYKKNSADALAEMQTKYQVEKKEHTIIQQQYDLTKKNFFIYTIAALFGVTLLFGFFFFESRKKTQRLKLQTVEMEEKKKTTQAVMRAEEEERKRIAADLHDSVAQKMVVAKINLEALGNCLNELKEPELKIYKNIELMLEESALEVRNLSHSMMPQAFVYSGFTSAVKDFLDKISKKDLLINFTVEGEFEMIEENKAVMIYRIIQECVQNVLKHANATRLDISMILVNNEMDFIIEDNGTGFNVNEVNEESTGLKNIASRIKYLNGKLDISSNNGTGTVIAFYIPL